MSLCHLSGTMSRGWSASGSLGKDIFVVISPCTVCSPFLGVAVIIQCILQDCASPESSGSPDPKRPAASEAASGSQERLDFNRNLQEGRIPVGSGVRSRLVSAGPSPCSFLPFFQSCQPLRSCCPVTGRRGFWEEALWKLRMSKVCTGLCAEGRENIPEPFPSGLVMHSEKLGQHLMPHVFAPTWF